MAIIENKLDLQLKIRVNIELTEVEARALDAMVGYGFDPFKKVFYEKLGQAYMKPHEEGLKSLFDTIKKNCGPKLYQIDELKKELKQSLIKTKNTITLT